MKHSKMNLELEKTGNMRQLIATALLGSINRTCTPPARASDTVALRHLPYGELETGIEFDSHPPK